MLRKALSPRAFSFLCLLTAVVELPAREMRMENNAGLKKFKSGGEVECDQWWTARFWGAYCWLFWNDLSRVTIWGYRVTYEGVQFLCFSWRMARGSPSQEARQTKYFPRQPEALQKNRTEQWFYLPCSNITLASYCPTLAQHPLNQPKWMNSQFKGSSRLIYLTSVSTMFKPNSCSVQSETMLISTQTPYIRVP